MIDTVFCDPRHESLGINLISFKENRLEKSMSDDNADGSIEFLSEKEYHVFRLLRYVAEVT